MDVCPPLEDIAAYLDGTLSPEERERITAHLASCESCYEVFAGAAQFQEDTKEEGNPLPFRPETNRRPPRWLALAASILLASALGFFVWRTFSGPPDVTFAGMIEQVEGSSGITEHLYPGETFRSGDETEHGDLSRSLFLAGVHLLDLRLHLQSEGDAKKRSQLVQDLGTVLQEIPGLTSAGDFYQRSKEGPWDREALFRQEDEVQQTLSEYTEFQFGLWTEAGRLAALSQASGFFDDRNNRRFLDRLFKETPWAGDDFLDEVPTDLQAIQEIWDSGKLTEVEYRKLATLFESIIKAYDTPDDL